MNANKLTTAAIAELIEIGFKEVNYMDNDTEIREWKYDLSKFDIILNVWGDVMLSCEMYDNIEIKTSNINDLVSVVEFFENN